MTWHNGDLEMLALEIELEMRDLAGAPYEVLENRAWQASQIADANRRAYDADRYSRAPEKRERYRRSLEWKENAKGRVVAIRCCPVCSRMFVVSAYMESERKNGACSPTHRYLASGAKSGRWKLIKIGQEKDTIAGWAKRIGLTEPAVRHRTTVLRWPLIKALTTPATPRDERRPNSLARRARDAGLSANAVRNRIRSGWSEEEAFQVGTRRQDAYADSLKARAKKVGLKYGTVRKRIASGMSPDEALATHATPNNGTRRWAKGSGGGLGPVTAAILNAISAGCLRARDIIGAVFTSVPGTSESSVRVTLSKLVRQGRLVRDGETGGSMYRLPEMARIVA
jgi:hypothetical protein